jgi:hypothetical protein
MKARATGKTAEGKPRADANREIHSPRGMVQSWRSLVKESSEWPIVRQAAGPAARGQGYWEEGSEQPWNTP